MIRLATVGTSTITEQFLSAVALTGEYELAAVYSRRRETGAAFAAKHGCGTVFTDLEQLAQSERIDAVYIASPNVFHAGQTELFLKNGKNVLCEKPIVTCAEDYRRLLALAEQNGLIYAEAIMSRHTAQRARILTALSEVGTLTLARIDFCQRSSRLDSFLQGEHQNIFDPTLHTGTLMDLGVYCVYAAVDLFGMPRKITASKSLLSSGADGSGCAIFDYGDFPAVLTYGKTGQSAIGSEIVGEKGALRIASVSQYAGVSLVTPDGVREIVGTPDRAEIMRGEAQYFADRVNGVSDPENDRAVDALTASVHRCMDQIKLSAGLVYPVK